MKKAFSLIELSIVILIIGILIAGVTQSTRLIAQMRLASARSLTQNSPVASINGLSLWLETTSKASFDDAQTQDGSPVTVWHDINPQSVSKLDVSQTNSLISPTYDSDAINGLPALQFDYTKSQYLRRLNVAGGDLMQPDQISVFLVQVRKEKPAGNDSSTTVYWGSNTATISDMRFNIHATHYNAVMFDFGTCCGSTSKTTSQYLSDFIDSPKVLSFVKNSEGNFEGRINGKTALSSTSMTSTLAPGIYNFNVGVILVSGNYFNGYIAEIIIFNRALSKSERQDVEAYLGKKWGIKIN